MELCDQYPASNREGYRYEMCIFHFLVIVLKMATMPCMIVCVHVMVMAFCFYTTHILLCSVQDILSSHFLHKNTNIYNTVNYNLAYVL